jgi:hypothetical protein
MTQLTSTSDALTDGKLRFAIVRTFNADDDPNERDVNVAGKPFYGDGSRDMTGTVRLMDGTVLQFAYADGRFPIRDGDMIRFNEEGGHPGNGDRMMSRPIEGNVVMVEVASNRVRRWTLPHLVLGGYYGINDHRYLAPRDYSDEVKYAGLHCVVDLTVLGPEHVTDMMSKSNLTGFPHGVAYIGHHADVFLANAPKPTHFYAIFAWAQRVGSNIPVSSGGSFPDGRPFILAKDLPSGWAGFVDDTAATLGPKPPGYISEGRKVYPFPASGRTATLRQIGRRRFEFKLPTGEEWAKRTTFIVAFAHD